MTVLVSARFGVPNQSGSIPKKLSIRVIGPTVGFKNPKNSKAAVLNPVTTGKKYTVRNIPLVPCLLSCTNKARPRLKVNNIIEIIAVYLTVNNSEFMKSSLSEICI